MCSLAICFLLREISTQVFCLLLFNWRGREKEMEKERQWKGGQEETHRLTVKGLEKEPAAKDWFISEMLMAATELQ